MQGSTSRLLALLMFASAAHAQETARTPTAQERQSFQDYQSRLPVPPKGARVVFGSVPAADGRGVALQASVEAPPHRGRGALCRTERVNHVLHGNGKQARWQSAGTQYYAWLDRGACRAVAEPVRMLQRVPDAELEGVLLYQKPLLERARLLMAGNTACAPARSYPFVLAAVDVGASRPGAEEQYALVFRSDRNTFLRIWLRKSGAQYDAWNVTCPAML